LAVCIAVSADFKSGALYHLKLPNVIKKRSSNFECSSEAQRAYYSTLLKILVCFFYSAWYTCKMDPDCSNEGNSKFRFGQLVSLIKVLTGDCRHTFLFKLVQEASFSADIYQFQGSLRSLPHLSEEPTKHFRHLILSKPSLIFRRVRLYVGMHRR